MTDAVDVVVVGSGPVGSAFARTILDRAPAASVLLLEAGPEVARPAGRHVRTIVDTDERELAQLRSQGPEQHPYADESGAARTGEDTPVIARPGTFLLGAAADGMPAAAMSSNVGGMGSHWTCACPAPGEGERIPFLPASEFDDVFAEAWRLLHVSQTAFEGAPLGAELRAALSELVDEGRPVDRRVQPMPLGITVDDDGSRYWTGPDVVLGDLLNGSREGFELRPDSIVQRVRFDGSRAVGVTVRSRVNGDVYDVDARHVVIAADALRTPQILHASGVALPALGHYLNEHPQVLTVVELDETRFTAADDARYTKTGQVDALSGVNWIPYDRDRLPYHTQVMQLDASPVPLSHLKETRPGSIVALGFFCTKDIQADDRVEFDDHRLDWQGLPAISIHYRLTDRDTAMLEHAKYTLAGLARALGTPVGSPEPQIMPAGSSLHYMGTVRMGETDDGMSVCDTEGRVWTYQSLYVGGNGVIPTPTACNPTATSVALAVRAARGIAAALEVDRDAA